MKDSCNSCNFWRLSQRFPRETDDNLKECRVRSPYMGCPSWPRTGPDEWCGEYKEDGIQAPAIDDTRAFPFDRMQCFHTALRRAGRLPEIYTEVRAARGGGDWTIGNLLALGRLEVGELPGIGETRLLQIDAIMEEYGVLKEWHGSQWNP
jgi:hypothetical protein